jgi:hypothetical protein
VRKHGRHQTTRRLTLHEVRGNDMRRTAHVDEPDRRLDGRRRVRRAGRVTSMSERAPTSMFSWPSTPSTDGMSSQSSSSGARQAPGCMAEDGHAPMLLTCRMSGRVECDGG